MDMYQAMAQGITNGLMLTAIRSYHDHVVLGTDREAHETDVRAYAASAGIGRNEALAAVLDAHKRLFPQPAPEDWSMMGPVL